MLGVAAKDMVAVLLVLLRLVEDCMASAQCVGLEGLEPGWQLEPQGQVSKSARGLEACRRLCVHWTPCRACSFRPDQRLCLLSASPPRQPSTPQSYGEGEFVFHVVNTTECQAKNPCSPRPCGLLEWCAPTQGGSFFVCLQGAICNLGLFSTCCLCRDRNLVYLNDAAVCMHDGHYSWEGGKEMCGEANGTMVSATSPGRLDDITHTIREFMAEHQVGNIYVWLGLSKKSGNWTWENGQVESGALTWSNGQPDGTGPCAFLYLNASTRVVDDGPCHEAKKVLCEFLL